MTKVCGRCSKEKDLSEFKPKKRYSLDVYCWCRECERQYNNDRYAKNPEKYRAADKKHYYKHREKRIRKSRGFQLKKKYWPNLSYKEALAEWDRIFGIQDGKCSICKKQKKLDVEHNHITGEVRSLACNGCNTALGRIHEDFNVALNLAKYILEHNGLPNAH